MGSAAESIAVSGDLRGDGVIGVLARHERLLWAIVVAAAIGDVVTTGVGLHVGLMEGNPIMADWIEGYGIVALLCSKVAVVLPAMLAVQLFDHPGRVVVPLGFGLPWLVATASNLFLIVAVTV